MDDIQQQVKEQVLNFIETNKVEHSDILKNFLGNHSELFSRTNQYGHITASACILNENKDEILLIEHKSLGMWLMPGGHVDEGEYPSISAKREAIEETNVDISSQVDGLIDINIHRIPFSEKKNEPEHWHFDMRYVFVVNNKSVNINEAEIDNFKWIKIKELMNDKQFKFLHKIK